MIKNVFLRPNENTKKKTKISKGQSPFFFSANKKIFKKNPKKGQEKPKNKTQCEKYKSIKPMKNQKKINKMK